MIIVDASVFVKLFLDEPDRQHAQHLFVKAITDSMPLLAPSLLFYEAFSVALHYSVPFEEVHELFAVQRAAGMRLVEPTLEVLHRARIIATSGEDGAGPPSLQDSIYHALAVVEGGVFITADAKHFAKASQFGQIQLLGKAE